MSHWQADISKLQAAGLIKTQVPEVGEAHWIVGLLLGGAAWVAGLFMLIFVGLLFEPNTPAKAFALGVVLVGVAWLSFASLKHLFVEQLALAFAMAGQVLLIYALAEALKLKSASEIALATCVVQIIMFVLLPNHLSRVLSALFATLSWALVWRLQYSFYGRAEMISGPYFGLVNWFFAIVPVLVFAAAAVIQERNWLASLWANWILPGSSGLIAGLCLAPIILLPFERSVGFGGSSLGLTLWPALSAIAALIALGLARANSHRGLMVLATTSAIISVIAFYYELGVSLLSKSILMIVLAGCAFALYAWLRGQPKEPNSAQEQSL